MIKFYTSTVLYVCTLLHMASTANIFSSLARMEDIFKFDHIVGDTLSLLPNLNPAATNYLESYLALAVDLRRGDPIDVTGNPLHIYTTIKRLTIYFSEVYQMLQTVLSTPELHALVPADVISKVSSVIHAIEVDGTILPNQEDLRGAALALARLQQVYRLNMRMMINGRMLEHACSARLTVLDCIRMANESYHVQKYSNAWQWYSAALEDTKDQDMRQHIADLREPIVALHDELHANNTWNHEFWPRPLSENRNQVAYDTHYFQLCRGDNHMTDEEKSRLRCLYNSCGNPWLILQPVKYEQLHYNPEMYLFYDVIKDNEIEIIKLKAKEKLERSLVGGHEVSTVSNIRVSHTGWLWNDTHPVLETLARRISAITGLKVYEGKDKNNVEGAGEALQVLSYGIGGHYHYHMDVLWKEKPMDQWNDMNVSLPGDRLATWMFYLSDVAEGGRTAFPKAGVGVAPVKGAAVFWYNLQPNGHANPRTEHGGCPVLRGHKWVANKWIRENLNADVRGCGLSPDW